MAKKFSNLEKKMSAEQLAKSDKLYQEMLDELNADAFEPDVVEWLQKQNSHTKHYVNELIRNVMRLQMG